MNPNIVEVAQLINSKRGVIKDGIHYLGYSHGEIFFTVDILKAYRFQSVKAAFRFTQKQDKEFIWEALSLQNASRAELVIIAKMADAEAVATAALFKNGIVPRKRILNTV